MLYKRKLSINYWRTFVSSVMLPFHGRRLNLNDLVLSFSSSAGLHFVAPFFPLSQQGHYILQLHPTPFLIGQIQKFAAYQNRSCSLTQCLKSLQLWLKPEMWHLVLQSFFFRKVYLENVDTIILFIHHCICGSIVFTTVLMIYMEGYCNGGTMAVVTVGPLVLSEWLYTVQAKHRGHKTAA